jgi:hypothetical protein
MTNNFSARRSKWCSIEIAVTKERSMSSRQGWMHARRAQQIERQDGLGEKSIPIGQWEMRINRAEGRNKMILESPNGSFCSIGLIFFRRHALERDVAFNKGILEFLKALVVKNVKIGGMTLGDERFMSRLLSFANASRLTIRNGCGVNGVGVMMTEDKNAVIAATGRNREPACLVRVGFHDLHFVEKHGKCVMARSIKGWFKIGFRCRECVSSKESFGRTQMFGFLILMTEDCNETFR